MQRLSVFLQRRVVAALVLLIVLGGSASASTTQVVAFGDSLSDSGNLFAAIGYPPSPYWNGRQSDGPVAVEYMAQRLGANLANFAWNGATTGLGNVMDGGTPEVRVSLPGMAAVFNNALFAGEIPVDPLAAYVLWGGPNDFLAITGPGDVPPAISRAVANLVTIVATLQFGGGANIIVAGMPDLSLTPRVASADAAYPGVALLMHAVSENFNAALAANLPPGARYFDTNAVLLGIYTNPGQYGITNLSAPCFGGGSVCSSPGEYLFWDDIHPTTAVHLVMGEALAQAAVPEPATVVLAGIGLVVLLFAGRRCSS